MVLFAAGVPLLVAGILALGACTSDTPGADSGDGGAAGWDGGSVEEGVVQVRDVTGRTDDEFGSFVILGWEQRGEGQVWVRYSFDAGDWRESPHQALGEGMHEVLLLGIPYESTVSWQLIYDKDGAEVVLEEGSTATDPLPEGLPVPSLLVADETAWEPTGTYLLGSINEDPGGWTGGTYWKWVLDRQGRVVWAHKTPENHWSIFLRISADGTHIVWDEATYWAEWDGGAGSSVHRWYLDGTEIEEIPTPGLHHAFTELPDGTLVWGSAAGGYENLVEKAPDSDETHQIWSCESFHVETGARGSCQSNTLYYHVPTDTFLFSFYTTSTVVEIDHQTGDSLWWAGGVAKGFAFTDPETQYSWQHGVNWTDEGTLLLSTEDTYGGMASETYAREYIVDRDARTLQQVWVYGVDQGVYASTAGEAHRLPNGNTLHNYGSASQIKEVQPDGTLVWHLDWGGTQLLGRTVFIEDLWSLMPPDAR